MRFVWRFEDTWYAVRMELRFSADSQGEALVTYAPVVIPYGVTTREVDILTLIALVQYLPFEVLEPCAQQRLR